MSCAKIDEKIRRFTDLCRQTGLRVTPQRIEIYKQLINTDEHPSAEMLYEKVRTLNDMGVAFIVEGSGKVRRFDGGMEIHQHFKCIKCKRIIDFQHKPFDNIKLPASIKKKFKILKKAIYLEGICDLCEHK